MVTKWVSWYKAHRYTLIQPVVHIRRADIQGWDGWLHVNPFGLAGAGQAQHGSDPAEVGVAMLFNPTDARLNTAVSLPLYYCGLDDAALLSVNGGAPQRFALNRDYSVLLHVDMPPRSIHTVVVTRPA